MARATLWKADFEAAGYRAYRDSLKDRSEPCVTEARRMYQGSYQKRISDRTGLRYWISIDLYDFSGHTGDAEDRSAAPHAQYTVDDDISCNVEFLGRVDSIEAVESFFYDLWKQMGWDYQERADPPT